MLATIRDGTWNMFNMQHITPNLKRWDYSDIPGGGTERKIKGPTHMIESGHYLRNRPQPPPTPQEVVVWHWLTGLPVLTNEEIMIYIYTHHKNSYQHCNQAY